MKLKFISYLPLLLIIVIYITMINANKGVTKGPKRYCGSELTKVMADICPVDFEKRSYNFHLQDPHRKNKLSLLIPIFNMDPNEIVSVDEIAAKSRLLFGQTNYYQKQKDINNLLNIYKNKNENEELANDRFNNYYGSINDNNYKSLNNQFRPRFKRESPLFKRESQIVEECCASACTLSQLMSYCPD